MIQYFKCKETEKLYYRCFSFKFPHAIQRSAVQKLLVLNDTVDLRDLYKIEGNRLEALKGDRAGQYSIRINRQWRICFQWKKGHACAVEIVDYH